MRDSPIGCCHVTSHQNRSKVTGVTAVTNVTTVTSVTATAGMALAPALRVAATR
jgi:hypothetical protein